MKITLVGLAVRYVRTHRTIARHTFFAGTYLLATTLAVIESGHVVEGVAIGLVAGSLKIGWHVAHSKFFIHH